MAHYLGMVMASVLMTIICLTLYSLRNEIGRMYTNDEAVLDSLSSVMPIIAIILWGDGFQNICSAALRGSGRQAIGATINLSALWLFGVPLAVALAFHYHLGVLGFWYGLLAAFTLQAIVMVSMVSITIDFDVEASTAQERMLQRAANSEVQQANAFADLEADGLEQALLRAESKDPVGLFTSWPTWRQQAPYMKAGINV
eukprot:scaffold36272_cov40-Prasinocladus_malaysianus.AAC.1